MKRRTVPVPLARLDEGAARGRRRGQTRRALRGALRGSAVVFAAVLIVASPRTADTQASEPASTTNPVMVALEQYIGTWRADDQTGPDGRTFHFIYDLAWFDSAHTIVEMLIVQHYEDGEERVLWKGFKGWAPGSSTVYYHGFSTGGRAAAGHLQLIGEDLVTEYDGWGPNGVVVRVRDVFSPVREGVFTGRTLVQAAPDADWVQVSSDRWSVADTYGSG